MADPTLLLASAERRARRVPPNPAAFVQDVVRGCLADLDLCLGEIAQAKDAGGGSAAVDEFEAQLKERRRLYRDLPTAPTRPIAAFPFPGGARAPGPLVGLPMTPSGWRMVDVEPARVLLRHFAGAMARVVVVDGVITAAELYEGHTALAWWASAGMRLPQRVIDALDEAISPLAAVQDALPRAFAGCKATLLFETRAEIGNTGFFAIETESDPWRSALVLVANRRRRIVGYRVVEGIAALEQRTVLAELGPHVGAPGEAFSGAQNQAEYERIAAEVAAAVRPFAEALQRGERTILGTVRPREADYGKVFLEPLAGRLRTKYEILWSTGGPPIRPGRDQTEIRVAVCTGGMFATANAASLGFPAGWRELPPKLWPHIAWVSITFAAPGADSGTVLDGLAWVDDHWALFPSPWALKR